MSQSVLKVNDLPAVYSGPCSFLLKACIFFRHCLVLGECNITLHLDKRAQRWGRLVRHVFPNSAVCQLCFWILLQCLLKRAQTLVWGPAGLWRSIRVCFPSGIGCFFASWCLSVNSQVSNYSSNPTQLLSWRCGRQVCVWVVWGDDVSSALWQM